MKDSRGSEQIEDFLLGRRALSMEQVEQARQLAAEQGLRFVDAAMATGALSREKLIRTFARPFKGPYFALSAEFFPESTRKLLSVEEMTKWGVLPLGYGSMSGIFRTRRVLNLGCLDPSDSTALKWVEARVGEPVRPYLVLGDQFLLILVQVFGVRESDLHERCDLLHPRLQLFLGGQA